MQRCLRCEGNLGEGTGGWKAVSLDMNSKFELSISDTNVLKGVALLFLLTHHLFYIQNGLFDDINICGDRFLVQEIGKWCKVCVAIFVFLSGYGLMVNAMKNGGLKSIPHFYWQRFVKLYMNYWFIWLLFVPIGIYVFDRTLSDVYGTQVFLRFALDFFGVLNCFGLYGYNSTWWFYSCIIVLYLSFPFIYKLMNKTMLVVIPIVLAIYNIPISQITGIKVYFVSFVMGMALCKYRNNTDQISGYWWFLLFTILSIERFVAQDFYLLDSIITLTLALSYKTFNVPKIVKKVLSFLGKHSMNIFLFHTFIFYYWFQEYIYMTRNPLIIFITLLGSCLLISIIIELLKKALHFDCLVNKIKMSYVRQ